MLEERDITEKNIDESENKESYASENRKLAKFDKELNQYKPFYNILKNVSINSLGLSQPTREWLIINELEQLGDILLKETNFLKQTLFFEREFLFELVDYLSLDAIKNLVDTYKPIDDSETNGTPNNEKVMIKTAFQIDGNIVKIHIDINGIEIESILKAIMESYSFLLKAFKHKQKATYIFGKTNLDDVVFDSEKLIAILEAENSVVVPEFIFCENDHNEGSFIFEDIDEIAADELYSSIRKKLIQIEDLAQSKLILTNIHKTLSSNSSIFLSARIDKLFCINKLNKDQWLVNRNLKTLKDIAELASWDLNGNQAENFYLKLKSLLLKISTPIEALNNIYSCLSPREAAIIKKCAEIKSYAEIGKIYNITRERVRQIERDGIQKQKFINDLEIFMNTLWIFSESDYYFLFEHVATWEICKNNITYFSSLYNLPINVLMIDSAEIFAFIRNKDNKIEWVDLISSALNEMPDIIFKNELDFWICKIKKKIFESGYNISDSIIEKLFVHQFIQAGTVYSKKRLTRRERYEIVLRKHFIDGIGVYDFNEIAKFRQCYKDIFNEDNLSDNDRALVARITSICMLSGRGKYILKIEQTISDQLLSDIYSFIIECPYGMIMTNTIMKRFNDELIKEGVDNKYYLQGLLRQKFSSEFGFKRDYIMKDNATGKFYELINEYVRKFPNGINYIDLQKEFDGVPDSVLLYALFEDHIISMFNKNYIHRDHIIFSEQEEFLENLKQMVQVESIVSDNQMYAMAKKKFNNFLANNHISTAFYLFSIIQAFFKDEFKFSRPHIIDSTLDINKGIDLIKEHFYERSQISISEIKCYAHEKDISIYSIIDFANSLEDYLWADKEILIHSRNLNIDDVVLEALERVIIEAMGDLDYAEISKLNIINRLPYIGQKWTSWLIYAIIYRYSANYVVITSSSKYSEAFPVVLRNDTNVDFVRERLEEENIMTSNHQIDDLSDIDKLVEGLVTDSDI